MPRIPRPFTAALMLLCGVLLAVAGCAGMRPDHPAANVDYELQGSGPEKVVVLHDWLGDRRNYDPVRPYLDGATFQFAFVDLRGYGGSTDKAGEFTAGEAAADAISVADALGWSEFHIVGHSMTGMVVQKVAVLAGDRVESIVATSPVSARGMQVDDKTYAFFEDVARDPEAMGKAVGLLTGGKLSVDWTGFKVARAMAGSTEPARLGYLAMFDHEDFSDQVKGIETPILVLLGRNDIEAFQPPAIQATFGAWYPNLQIAQVTDAGHYAMQEVPALYASIVQTFLRQHGGG